MTPLQRLKSLDARFQALLHPLPSLLQALDQCLSALVPDGITARDLMIDARGLLDRIGERLRGAGPFALPPHSRLSFGTQVLETIDHSLLVQTLETFCQQLRAHHHARLANYWTQRDSQGLTRRQRLIELRREQLLAEIDLRLADRTLDDAQAYQLRISLELPQPWQRQHLPAERRPQLYRPLLGIDTPNWRSHLPGSLVIVARGPQGRLLDHHEDVGPAVLCSLSHGIEAFASLADLHIELCERLDDPLQSESMLRLYSRPDAQQRARMAERLRYDWFTENLLQEQIDRVIEAQAARMADAWLKAWNQGIQRHLDAFDAVLGKSMDLMAELGSSNAIATRYALLLEKHLPAWLRNSSQQSLAHIVQTLQELVQTIEQAAAPGILTLQQFSERTTLLTWTRQRLREHIRHAPGLELDPAKVQVSVTLARQIGPLVNPLMPSSYIPVASRPQVGDTVELVNHTYALDELALLNIGWFDVDYWLTARVHHLDNRDVDGLTPKRVRRIIRELDAGSGYNRYLRAQLLDSPAGKWRQDAHGRINCARMRAEAVKARYAGHFLPDPLEQGYRWVKTILRYPNSNWRATVEEHRISVRQLVIQGHTLQGVLLLTAEVPSIASFVVYTPDAPDQRPWREYRDTRQMLRSLRNSTALRRYVTQRLPLADARSIDRLLLKGRLGPHVSRPTIEGDLFKACYRAEVQALMSRADASSRSSLELLGETALSGLWLLLDLVSLVLPSRALSALAFGRAAIAVLGGLEAMQEDDREQALDHAFNALSHTVDGLGSFAGSTVLRRAMRGLPKPPSAPIPNHYVVAPDTRQLRYRISEIHDEGVYVKTTPAHGLPQYFIQNNHGQHYQVSFDGQRWRAIDPRLPDAHLKVPLKRRKDGEWVIDSPVLWYDGLPDLARLFADCALSVPLAGEPLAQAPGVFDADGQLYLQAGPLQLPLRPHLLDDHYHLRLPVTDSGVRMAWAVLHWQDGEWRIRVRQTGRCSDWLALPERYSVSRGNT